MRLTVRTVRPKKRPRYPTLVRSGGTPLVFARPSCLDQKFVVTDPTAQNLANNVRALREARGVSQQQIAQIAGIPRPTWATIESGEANPTLAVLTRVASALGARIEELLSEPHGDARHWPAETLPLHRQGRASVRTVVDHPHAGLIVQRIVLQPSAVLISKPQVPQTYAYLTCELGEIQVELGVSHYVLMAGDLLTFRADQPHTFRNPTRVRSVAFSVVSPVRPA
jgi:transcriptional regulator with XRE-family HTH domain